RAPYLCVLWSAGVDLLLLAAWLHCPPVWQLSRERVSGFWAYTLWRLPDGLFPMQSHQAGLSRPQSTRWTSGYLRMVVGPAHPDEAEDNYRRGSRDCFRRPILRADGVEAVVGVQDPSRNQCRGQSGDRRNYRSDLR